MLFHKRRLDPAAYLILWQAGVVGDQGLAGAAPDVGYRQLLVARLAADYPLRHKIVIYRAATLPIHAPRIERVTLRRLADARLEPPDTLVLPPARKLVPDTKMLRTLERIRA